MTYAAAAKYGVLPIILAHAGAALLALLLGSVIMLRRKGTMSHRRLGWCWVVLMLAVCFSAVPIRSYRGIPNIDGFTPIHLFIVLVLTQIPRAILAIRRGDVGVHARAMRGTFFGGLVIAGAFTLLPDRMLGHLLWHNLLGVM